MEVQSSASPQTGVTQPGTPLAPAVNMAAGDAGEAAPVESPAPAETETPAEAAETPSGTESDTKPEGEEAKREEEDFSRRFAALTRKERDILARERRVKEQEPEIAEARAFKDQLKKNPMKVLTDAGWTFKDLADIVLNDGQLPADKQQRNVVDELRAKIESLEAQLAGDKEAQQQSQVEKEINQFKENIKTKIGSNLDKYELINVNEAFDMVYDVIESHFEQTLDPETGYGEILDIDKAAEAVEKHLEEQASRFLKAKKIAGRLRPQDSETPHENPEAKAKIPPSPTLTNRQTSGATPPAQGEHYLSDEESKRAAAAYLEKRLAEQARA